MTWLTRLKNSKAPATHATKPTKPPQGGSAEGFVGFVAPMSEGFQNFEGDRHGVDAGDAARLVASSEGGLDHTTERASAPSTTDDQSHHGAKAIAAAATPLVQEKILEAPGTHATKPTKPGFVGFVAYPQGGSGNSHPARTCRDCSHRLAPGTCGEPVAAGLAPHYAIRWAPEGHAATCPAFAARPVAPPKSWNHAPASDAELAAMAQRCERFERMGYGWLEAGRLADKLLIRDRSEDDRRLCAECQHLRGRPGAWRCSATNGMPEPMVAALQRCPGFEVAP